MVDQTCAADGKAIGCLRYGSKQKKRTQLNNEFYYQKKKKRTRLSWEEGKTKGVQKM